MILRQLGRQAYEPVWRAMQAFTQQRDATTPDELWIVEHEPVYTLGMNGKPEHVLNPGDIPLVQIDRGGQVTYHGPGQLVIYMMFDLKRHGWGVRNLVTAIEQAIIQLLAEYGIEATARPNAPGVYVGDAKIAALGLRIRRNCSFHGLALNIDMDLSPFDGINPCGYAGMPVTQLKAFGVEENLQQVANKLVQQLRNQLALDDTIQVENQLPENKETA